MKRLSFMLAAIFAMFVSPVQATQYPISWTFSTVDNVNGPTVLTGVDNHLKVVGYWSANGINTAVTTECSDGCAGWTKIGYPEAVSSMATGMDTGTAAFDVMTRTIVGYYFTSNSTTGYYHQNGAGYGAYPATGTQLLSTSHIQCVDVKAWACHGQQIQNPDPLVVGLQPVPNTSDGQTQAFEYDLVTKATTVLAPPGAWSAAATGINGHGSICGYMLTSATSKVSSWYYRYGRYVTIAVPNAIATIAHAVNWQGEIVGEYMDASNVTHGFVDDQPQTTHPTFITVDVPGATSTSIRGIQAHNVIVGSYVDSGGITHGFLGMPVPSNTHNHKPGRCLKHPTECS